MTNTKLHIIRTPTVCLSWKHLGHTRARYIENHREGWVKKSHKTLYEVFLKLKYI